MRCGKCGKEVNVEQGFKTCGDCGATYEKKTGCIGTLISLVGFIFVVPGAMIIVFGHVAQAILLIIVGVGILLVAHVFFAPYQWVKEKVIIDRKSWE